MGETGLDYFRDRGGRDRQRKLFEAQLDLAAELGKPVVIHTREADADTADVLAGFDGTVVMHCFSSPGLLQTVVDRGYYVSFAGNVTFPKAGDLRRRLRKSQSSGSWPRRTAPISRPRRARGRPNEPANVVLTIAELAKARGGDADELAAQIDANATAAFSLP